MNYRTTLVSVIEESFHNVLQKQYGSDENFDVIVNPENGDFEIYRNRVVVADDEVEDTNTQISLSEAQKIDEDYEIGEDVAEKINFSDFGRRSILNLRQTMASKILELEHDNLYNKYIDKVGTIITAEVITKGGQSRYDVITGLHLRFAVNSGAVRNVAEATTKRSKAPT